MIGSRSKGYGIGKSRFNKKSQGMILSELAKSNFVLKLEILQIKVEKMKE